MGRHGASDLRRRKRGGGPPRTRRVRRETESSPRIRRSRLRRLSPRAMSAFGPLRYASVVTRRARLLIRPMRPSDQDFISELGGSAFAEYAREPRASVLSMARRGHTVIAV